MNEQLPKHPMPTAQEDLQEATFAAMRRLLEEAKELPALTRTRHRDYTSQRTADESRDAALAIDALLIRIDAALAGEPGRVFVDHMHRLERETAAFRQAIGHLRYCAHGCATACPHTRLYLQVLDGLTLQGVTWQLQSSAPEGGGDART